MNHLKVYNAWFLLRVTYAAVPIIIGLDKCFTWLLVDWIRYTSPWILSLLPASITATQFILITGIIEILAGLLVWFRPRAGAYLVFAWMFLVILNLASMNLFYDIIARDAVIAVGALTLAWLSEAQESVVG
jgi:hypothetical protein